MKNFFKKLSFVLAVAMVLTSITPATASAAAKNYIYKSGKDSALTSVNVWFGDKATDLNVKINGKKNVAGTWKVGNTKVATVDKNGVITPVANGTTTVKFTAKTGEAVKVQVVVGTRVKTVKPYLADDAEKTALTELALNIGDEKEIKLGLGVSATAAKAGAKTTSMVTAAKVDGTAVEVVKGAGQRTFTVKAVEAGEATITIGAHKTTALVEAGKFFKSADIKVTVADGLAITDLKADKVNVLTATFASAVDTEDVTVSVVKGANAVDAKVEWNADKTVATITTTAKMTEGTYTVKAASAKDAEPTAEKSVDIVSQYVKEIQILNEVALTGKADLDGITSTLEDAALAYVYYKVVDQYGEDLTASTSIQWSTSCGTPSVSRSEGKLTLKRADSKAFTYGEQIYVTGVYTKTGVSTQATLTVGTEQSLHSIEMAGFVRKNTTTLLQSLPNGFKSGEYYLVFDALDQNGNALKASSSYSAGNNEVTFISDNYLVISDIKGGDTTLVIDGHEYNAVLVAPGQFVSKGGEVNITAVATKTGNKTVMNYVVGENQILTSFTMSAPTVNVVADGESVEIPFTALDQNGEPITNFVTLADNLNKLSFSVSDGLVKLSQKNDGTAKLVYSDTNAPAWNDSRSTDGIDRTVSITSVVVGGGSDNLMLSISDKARPDAISAVDLKPVYLEGTTGIDIKLSTFTFLDQYGRKIDKDSAQSGYTVDNGFFMAASNGAINGLDFSGYAYDVVVEYKGNANAITNGAINGTSTAAVVGLHSGSQISFNTDAQTQTAMTGNNFVFAIAKVDKNHKTDVAKYENVSTTINHSFTVVDIKQVRNFTVADMKMQFVQTDASDKATGSLAGFSPVTGAATGIDVKNPQTVSVKGTYNGVSVDVPKEYYTVAGSKLVASSAGVALGDNVIDEVTPGALTWDDLYDVTTAQYLRKTATDSLKVTIYEIYSNGVNGQQPIGTGLTLGAAATTQAAILRDAVSKTIQISDALPRVTTVNVPETYVVNPDKTVITVAAVLDDIEDENHYWLNWNLAHMLSIGTCTILDQYGNSMYVDATDATPMVSFKVSQIEEAAGYADNNFTVTGNDTFGAVISGAEIGDKFVLTVTVNDGLNVVSKDIIVTVGADKAANLNNNINNYTNSIDGVVDLKDTLENQRQATLN